MGQYEDRETGLYYNRFRYYDPDTGNYLSQDPIGLAGNNPTLYSYVSDTNSKFDFWGLDWHHIIPNQIYREFSTAFDSVTEYAQNISKKGLDKTNLIDLDTPFHGNHPKFSDYVRERVEKLVKKGMDIDSIRELQDELIGHINDALENYKKTGMNLNDYFKNNKHLKCK